MSTTTATFDDTEGSGPGHAVEGEELRAVAGKLSDAEQQRVLIENTLGILNLCVCSQQQQPERSTGLVVGRVQSGKTMSFTALTAAAHDNGYRLVVVLAGTQNNVADQTLKRLESDLRVDEGWHRPWSITHNPDQDELAPLRQTLSAWDSPTAGPGSRKTCVLTVLKHHQRLMTLSKLLGELGGSAGATLIIDDEADQASLDTTPDKDESSKTHQAILDLRATLPRHTFLQYTATPQANLLIKLIGELSPDFAWALEPGPGYVGGEDFFAQDGDLYLAREIPDGDIPADDAPPTKPPASLHEALRVFFLTVADLHLRKQTQVQRSMMVHPSRLQSMHDLYHRWVAAAKKDWAKALDDPVDAEHARQHFHRAYLDLAGTVDDLAPFKELLPHLRDAIERTRVEKINATGRQKTLPWKQRSGWILVGGQSLDRGFTVEGLTTTYMPRGSGVGNADTIQQRGRFFGYKRDYLGHCRLYLEGDLLQNYRKYIAHERNIHEHVQEHRASGKSLKELARRLKIDKDLQPTRRSIQSANVRRSGMRASWFQQRSLLYDVEACAENGAAFALFFSKHRREDDPAGKMDRRHDFRSALPLSEVRDLLRTFKIAAPRDANGWRDVLESIDDELRRDRTSTATLVHMRPGKETERAMVETNGEWLVKQAFASGVADNNPSEGEGGPDRQCFHPQDAVTVQLHTFDLFEDAARGSNRGLKRASAVPLVAVHLADRMLIDTVILDPADER